jgi:hypothetical protein
MQESNVTIITVGTTQAASTRWTTHTTYYQSQTYRGYIYAKCCLLYTKYSNMHDNPINGQQFYCSALSDRIDPPDSPVYINSS